MSETSECPLCCRAEVSIAVRVAEAAYRHCEQCKLVFQEPAQRLDADAERAVYELHENDIHDPRYRKFLAQLAEPMIERLEEGAKGLDYGAGPGPALATMFNERGYPTAIHDPFFAPDEKVLATTYDFISCTEVIEHMHHPLQEFERLDRLLNPGGMLGIMTMLRPSLDAFENWHYHRDPTHVCFYAKESIRWIARHFDWQIDLMDTRVVILRKRAVNK